MVSIHVITAYVFIHYKPHYRYYASHNKYPPLKTHQIFTNKVQQRLDILNAYQKSLDGDNSEFDAMSDNQYYSEFKDRKELLNTSIDVRKEHMGDS